MRPRLATAISILIVRRYWWSRNGSAVVTLYFVVIVVGIPIVLALAGQHALADGYRDWQLLVVPTSAAAAHFLYHQDEGAHAVAFGILIGAGWWLMRQFPRIEDCFDEEGCGMTEAQMGSLAIFASAAL